MPNALRNIILFFLTWSALLLACYFGGVFFPVPIWFTTLAAVGVTAWLVRRLPSRHAPALVPTTSSTNHDGAIALLLGLPMFSILLMSVVGRTGEEIHSPWQRLPAAAFALFCVGVALRILFYRYIRRRSVMYCLDALFLLCAFGVNILVYAQGFGFDPFLHEAAITALLRDGVIHPVTPLYALYYAVVGAVSTVTTLSVATVNSVIVPMLSIALLGFALPATWLGASTNKARAVLLPALLVVPFAFFTFSIPFHLAVLLCLLHIAWRRSAFENRTNWLLHAGILLAACFAHPMPSLLLLILFGGETLWRRAPRRLLFPAIVATTVAAGVALPATLIVTGKAMIIPDIFAGNMYGVWLRCVSLFIDPYRVTYLPIPAALELLYDVRRIATLAIPLALLAWPTLPRDDRRYGIALVAAHLLACFGLVQLSYANIISYEHFEFALRLLGFTTIAVTVLCVPHIAMPQRRIYAGMAALLLAITVTTSWYFSYAAFDAKNLFTAPSVSTDDIATVRAIERDASGKPYIVLSHQMLAAAALRVYGFRELTSDDGKSTLWYPIPTGGTLYPLFTGYLAQPSDATIAQAADFMNVTRVYVVIHDSWPYANEIRADAANTNGVVLHTGINGRSVMVYTLHNN